MLQEPGGYLNKIPVDSFQDLDGRVEENKLYHLAQYKTSCICIDYFHHFILDKRSDEYFIYECASIKPVWKFKGVSEVRKIKVSKEDLETRLDFDSGLWLIFDEKDHDYSKSLGRAENLIGEQQYMPSGETCETFVRDMY